MRVITMSSSPSPFTSTAAAPPDERSGSHWRATSFDTAGGVTLGNWATMSLGSKRQLGSLMRFPCEMAKPACCDISTNVGNGSGSAPEELLPPHENATGASSKTASTCPHLFKMMGLIEC